MLKKQKIVLMLFGLLVFFLGLLSPADPGQAALRPQYMADKVVRMWFHRHQGAQVERMLSFLAHDDLAELYQLVEAHPLVQEIRDYQHGGFNLRLYYGLRQVFFDELRTH